MIKNNKWILIISSLLILFPIFFGLAFWNKLPEQMVIHWGIDGVADGFSNRSFVVFSLPLFILLLHWFCILITYKDPKTEEQNPRVFNIIFWICPIISLFANGIIYATALGKEFNVGTLILLFVGSMFVIIGNYLPECKQNHTIGIRIKWTLENEENWIATHRMAGKLWIGGGILFCLGIFLPGSNFIWILISLSTILIVIPVVYSYIHNKKQIK